MLKSHTAGCGAAMTEPRSTVARPPDQTEQPPICDEKYINPTKSTSNNARLLKHPWYTCPCASNSAADAQLTNLLQHLLNSAVKVALCILLASIRIEILLYLGHARVGFGTESQLDLDQGFETGIEVGNAEVDELREFGEKLLIQLLICSFGHLSLLLSARQLRYILVGLLDKFLDLGAHGIVVEQLVVTFLDT